MIFFFKSLRSQGANVLRMKMFQVKSGIFFCTMIFYFTFYLAQGFLVIFYRAAFSLNFFPPIMIGLAFLTDLLVLNDYDLMICCKTSNKVDYAFKNQNKFLLNKIMVL